jgi:2-polyprenyl-6-methoxyphenol hydroxylase-like FAD-dependent oxidoreductase
VTELSPGELPESPFNVYWGPGSRFAWYRIGPSTVSWLGGFAATQGLTDPEGSKTAALARFDGWPPAVGALIDATPPEQIIRSDVLDRPPSERWGEGRATLLGDAAHPMTFAVGQGATQALEDAVVLAGRLRDGGLSAVSLRDYEHLRMERTAHFQNLAWRMARIGLLRKPVTMAARAALFRASGRFTWKAQERDYDFDV